MPLKRIINKLSEFFSGLYHRQWERWELIAIAIAASVLLIIIVRAHFKVAADKKRYRYRSPIVGIKKEDHKRRH